MKKSWRGMKCNHIIKIGSYRFKVGNGHVKLLERLTRPSLRLCIKYLHSKSHMSQKIIQFLLISLLIIVSFSGNAAAEKIDYNKWRFPPIISPTIDPGSNMTGGGPSFSVVVYINSIPSGAEIWIDNSNTEKLTNDTVSFEFGGSFILKLILSGYETYEMSCDVSDKPITVLLVPTVTPTTTPTVTPTTTQLPFQIRSNPDGAQIWIDGEFTGKLTPDIIYFDSSGSHTYELRLNGYQPYQQSVYISDSITKEVTLIPLQTTNPSFLSKIIEFIRRVFAFQN